MGTRGGIMRWVWMKGVVAYAKGNDDERKDESDYLIAAGRSLGFKTV
jgi:hypothetical protein